MILFDLKTDIICASCYTLSPKQRMLVIFYTSKHTIMNASPLIPRSFSTNHMQVSNMTSQQASLA